jgi:hypothetical protein
MKTSSEEIRLRHLYRKLIVMGKVKVSFEAARRLSVLTALFISMERLDRSRRGSGKR